MQVTPVPVTSTPILVTSTPLKMTPVPLVLPVKLTPVPVVLPMKMTAVPVVLPVKVTPVTPGGWGIAVPMVKLDKELVNKALYTTKINILWLAPHYNNNCYETYSTFHPITCKHF